METNTKSKIGYTLRKAKATDIDLLIMYKLSTILKYANDLSYDELNRIKEYVKNSVPREFDNYRLILIDGKVVGCISISDLEDGKLLDEIYLDDEYRNKGIGSSLIKEVLDNYQKVYLWVYKDNKQAIDLYFRLGFLVYDETESRYRMVHYKP